MRNLHRKIGLLVLWTGLVFAASCSAAPADDAATRAQSLFDEAIALRGEELQASAYKGETASGNDGDATADNATAGGSLASSTALFGEAARLFEAGETGWYEAANAWWWAGQPARAVLLYRRHLAQQPFHAAAWENLAEARRDAGTLDPGGETLLDWPWHLWLAATAAFFASLALASLALCAYRGAKTPGARRPLRAAIALGSLALAAALSLPVIAAFERPVVVLLAPVQGRMGDADVYAPQPQTPWKAGQEGRLVARREGWLCMKVGSVESWVPADRAVVVDLAKDNESVQKKPLGKRR